MHRTLVALVSALTCACAIEDDARQLEPLTLRTLGDEGNAEGFEDDGGAEGAADDGGDTTGDPPLGPSYTDERDNGDDPWKGGCHIKWTDGSCQDNKTVFKSDQCTSATDLMEYGTIKACHGPSNDKKPYDCDKECRDLHYDFGACVEDGTCDDGRTTHKCECYWLED